MPVIKSAKKKLRQDKKRTMRNTAFEEVMKKALKKAKSAPTAESVRLATKATDKAVKHHLLHKNRAARIKSSLSQLLSGKTAAKKSTSDTKSVAGKKAKPAKKATAKKSAVKKATKTSKK